MNNVTVKIILRFTRMEIGIKAHKGFNLADRRRVTLAKDAVLSILHHRCSIFHHSNSLH